MDEGLQGVGLARSDTSAAALVAAGAEVQRGDLDDLDTLRQAATATDGVIHIAFKAFTGDMTGAAAADLTVIEAIGSALAGTDKPFVTTGVTLMLWMGGITDRPGTCSGESWAGTPSEEHSGMQELWVDTSADAGDSLAVTALASLPWDGAA